MAVFRQTFPVESVYQYASNNLPEYNWITIKQYGGDHCWFGGNVTLKPSGTYQRNTNTCCFVLPVSSIAGVSSNLKLTAQVYAPESHNYYWAICTSMANKTLYEGQAYVTSSQDSTQVGSGTFYLPQIQRATHVDTISINIPAIYNIEQQHYLYFWTKENDKNTNISPHIYGTISFEATYDAPTPPVPPTPTTQGVVHIGNGSTWNDYTIHIGNGSTFDQYEAYIGTGNSWALLT